MHVAILGIKSVPAVAGADRVVELLLNNFPDEDMYTIYVVRSPATTRVQRPNWRYVEIPALPGKYAHAPSYFLIAVLHCLIFGNYDIAHVHNSDFGVFSLMLKLRHRPRILGTFHGEPYTRAKWGVLAQAFLRFSEWCFVRACDMLTSVTPTKAITGRSVRFIPNGIDDTVIADSDGASLREFGVCAGDYVVFACGRLDPTKGLHHLLAAYRELPETRALVAVGDFSHDSAYASAIRISAAADPRVILRERLMRREQLLELISRSAVFVFPSEVEGMSMMLLEVIGCGKAVVCSDIAENVAVVGADYPFLFRSGDSGSLAKVLSRALADERRDGTTREIYGRVLGQFRWPTIAAEYVALYTTLAEDATHSLPAAAR